MNRARIVALLLGVLVPAGFAEHSHTAPHGGTLVALGEHFAHLEVRVAPSTGLIQIWVLDGEASGAVRIQTPSLELKVRNLRDARGRVLRKESLTVTLGGVSNMLTGETAGNTSEFEGFSPALKGVARFEALIRHLKVRGVDVDVTRFDYPEGNEGKAAGATGE